MWYYFKKKSKIYRKKIRSVVIRFHSYSFPEPWKVIANDSQIIPNIKFKCFFNQGFGPNEFSGPVRRPKNCEKLKGKHKKFPRIFHSK